MADPWCGRPTEVREETNQSVRLPSSTPLAPTNIENISGHLPPTYAPHTTHNSNATSTIFPVVVRLRSHYFHLPRMQERAGGGLFLLFGAAATTNSLACNRDLEVVFIQCRNAVLATTTSLAINASIISLGGSLLQFDAIRASSTPLPYGSF